MLTQVLLVASASASEVTCVDELDSTQLGMAIDAALMELQGEPGWFHGLRISNGYANPLGVFSCTPDDEKWVYPPATEATGLLKRVLDSGQIKVAGVQWSQPGAADYKTTPEAPTGFWPDYLTEIVGKMSEAYGIEITIQREYYDNSVLVVSAVDDGDVDMSEPYYYWSGFHLNQPRIEALDASCITAGMASKFFVTPESNITNVDELYDVLEAGPNRLVGFIGQGNFDAVSAMLPTETTPVFTTNAEDIEANVLSGTYVAGYVSEGEPTDADSFVTFETGIISPRVALLRKPKLECTADDGGLDTISAAIIFVLAAVSLILALIMAYAFTMEKKGKPLFMPLIVDTPTKGVEIPKSAV
jgi:hypothetical protein